MDATTAGGRSLVPALLMGAAGLLVLGVQPLLYGDYVDEGLIPEGQLGTVPRRSHRRPGLPRRLAGSGGSANAGCFLASDGSARRIDCRCPLCGSAGHASTQQLAGRGERRGNLRWHRCAAHAWAAGDRRLDADDRFRAGLDDRHSGTAQPALRRFGTAGGRSDPAHFGGRGHGRAGD